MIIREMLSAYAHKTWSGWMKYMFGKSIVNEDGSITIPANLVARWTRQSNTVYSMLPEAEKLSDRAEADVMLEIFNNVSKNSGNSSKFI